MKNNERRSRMPRLVVALITSVAAMAVSAANPAVRPQLVVGIMIDGLDTQYLDLLREQFGPDGFNRLLCCELRILFVF